MSEPSYLAAVRESYDTVAGDYAARVKSPGEMSAPSRAMLTAFAELVRGAGLGPVADLGCGPGRVTAYMAGLGLPMIGVDLSPEMIRFARRAHPGLAFAVGSMTAVGLGSGTLGGVLAWYSTHHTPPESLPVLFAEFRRVLAPGGHLLLGGHAGDEEVRPARAYGRPVSYTSYFLPVDRIAALLTGAGLVVTARLEEARDEPATRSYVCLLARKPDASP
ncbi:class I SAM-dependent DNA methyltransferase [Streptomyces sp. NPDC054887]